MGRKLKTLNKHQKAAFRAGEHRTRREDIALYLEMAASDMPEERLEAAENLCPCHVRTSIDAVQDAVYRMLEDDDVRVRRAAWHTFEDGGVPDDPALEPIFARAHEHETDPMVRRFITEVAEPILKERSQVEFDRARLPTFNQMGKCDGSSGSHVVDREKRSLPLRSSQMR